jgi:Domain of unknown function (DUF5666)
MMKHRPPVTNVNRRTALLAMAGSALQLAACGGGVDVAGLSSGGTGSFTSGTIVGLGSIIVNGIRYDDSQARIIGESSSREALKLGMVVSIQGSSTETSNSPGALLKATASQIRYGSEWRGPLGHLDTVNGSFTLLGQQVEVLAATVFDGVADLAGLAALTGAVLVEVYGYLDPSSGHLQATRVEAKSSLQDYRLSGVVVQKSDANFTLLGMGTGMIAYSANTQQSANWGVDSLVHVRLDAALTPLTALEIRTPAQALADFELDEDDEAEIEGIVTSYTVGSTRFAVNGIEINGSAVTHLSGLGLAIGVRVEVEGRISGGQIIASQIEVKGSSSELKDDVAEYEFHGQLSELTDNSFMLRGYRIGYDPAILEPGLMLENGLYVEVKAAKANGLLQAVEIELED